MTEKLSLTDLQLIIRDSLYIALPDFYWVVAEVAEIKENYSGHCYLELIEKQADEKNIKARVKAIIWSNRYRFLRSFFENITGEPLREGFNILVKVKIEYHELYGLSLVISDIDPAFTVGEMAMKRQLIIKRLEQDGVFSMNKELDFPAFPQRIAIISSKSAAGYSDFINHLTGNSYGYVFQTALIESAMQGAETESGVISALDKIATYSHLFDLVVIIRGGGSQTDLSWFDNYNIAYYITQFPLPVITGIGHDKDLSVTDLVAHKSLKTPTAVADFLIECVAGVDRHLFDMSLEIKDFSRIILEKNINRIEKSKIKLLPLSRLVLAEIKDKLSEFIIEIINIGKGNTAAAAHVPANQRSRLVSAVRSFSSLKEAALQTTTHNLINRVRDKVSNKNTRLTSLSDSLNILNPRNVLERGYTITSANGVILKNSKLIKTDDIIDTQFSDGSVKSRVFQKPK
jgi:exodeoxyribonuclease VII large subunit